MRIRRLHSWDLTPTEAVALQRELSRRIDTTNPVANVEFIAGADVSCMRFSARFFAAVVVLRADDLTVVETQYAEMEVKFPYVPGLLSFREAPVVLAACAKVKTRPDVVLLDGQGYAHPRRIGLASHVGLGLDVPTIGCAKSLLCGKHGRLGEKRGAAAFLEDKGDRVGMAVRTRKGVKPVYVSAGNGIDLESSVRLVLACTRGYRLPEPTRRAHILVNEVRRRSL